MSETLATIETGGVVGSRFLSLKIGWRNLWRNKRRTALTSGGIGFAVLLVVFSMAMQHGQYGIMTDNGTSLMSGHAQIHAREYIDDERFEDTIEAATPLLREIAAVAGVKSIAPRVEAFGLVSADERSFGAQVLGVDAASELETVRFLAMLEDGRTMTGSDEVVLGTVLARNLGVTLGDDVVVLGTAKEGGVAALAFTVVGLLKTGQVDIDRALLLADLPAVQNGFALGDEVHSIVIRLQDLDRMDAVLPKIRAKLPAELVARDWTEIMPELKQAIDVDRIGGEIMFWIIMVLVLFSVVNSFIMTVFERTREFGMMRAIGMRPRTIIAMVQWEALFLWVLGASMGLILASLVVWSLLDTGIYMGESMEEMAAQFYMPSRLYPAFSLKGFLLAPLVMLIGTQIAAFLPSLRIRSLRPVSALRTE